MRVQKPGRKRGDARKVRQVRGDGVQPRPRGQMRGTARQGQHRMALIEQAVHQRRPDTRGRAGQKDGGGLG